MSKHGYKVYKDIREKKLTAANSFLFEDVAFYIVKQNENRKAIKLFAAYLYPSGVLITSDYDKDMLKVKLASGIDSIKKFMSKFDIEGT